MFVVVGAVGAVLLLVFLMFDDLLEGLLPDNDWISGPAIGAFLAAFGLFGWTAERAFDTPRPVAATAGVAGGLALGWFAVRLSKALLHSPTDATPATRDLIGQTAQVVTPVPAGGVGEVLVRLGGQPVKLAATADEHLARGAESVVIDTLSPTRVVVQSVSRFWAGTDEHPEPDPPNA
ncbi:MAG TPA: hypothetical protein VNQ73_24005 [Ilumatobacter sp.]|nr:hypothetical protein [Ilumatobacter sp.]